MTGHDDDNPLRDCSEFEITSLDSKNMVIIGRIKSSKAYQYFQIVYYGFGYKLLPFPIPDVHSDPIRTIEYKDLDEFSEKIHELIQRDREANGYAVDMDKLRTKAKTAFEKLVSAGNIDQQKVPLLKKE